MNELRMNGFEALAMDEMMTVDGGAITARQLADGAATLIGAMGLVNPYCAAGALVYAGTMYMYDHAPRQVPSNRHHR